MYNITVLYNYNYIGIDSCCTDGCYAITLILHCPYNFYSNLTVGLELEGLWGICGLQDPGHCVPGTVSITQHKMQRKKHSYAWPWALGKHSQLRYIIIM